MDDGFVPHSLSDWQARADQLGLRRQGRELVGACPSCGGEDRFSVSEKAGRAVFQCRGCNPGRDNPEAFQAILKAAGFADEHEPAALGPPDTTYVYRDPKGDAYHEVYWWGKGSSKVIRQKPGYRGKFYPYRIEHHPDWHDLPIVVAEGEKCADHLARLGYAAVTWCGGADGVTRTLWGALAGREVVLWADSDASGKGSEAMHTLAEILEGLGCDLKMIAVPEDKPDKWDAADATDEEIHRLVDEAKSIEGADVSARPIEEMGGRIDEWPRAMTPEEFQNLEIPDPSWLLEGVLPDNGTCMIASKPDAGKSTTTRTLAITVALGGAFLGRQTRQGPVWYGGFEEDQGRARLHFQAMGFNGTQPIHSFIGFPPDELDPYEWLEAEIKRIQPVLMIVDTVSDLLKIEDESKYAEVRKKMRPLMAMARQHRTCILLCHHTPKGNAHHWTDQVMGSQGFRGSVDTTLILNWTDERRTLRSTQRYGEPMQETVLVLDPVTERIESGGTVTAERARNLEEEVLSAVADHDGPLNKTMIEETVGGNHARVRKTLDKLCEDGRLSSRKEGRAMLYECP